MGANNWLIILFMVVKEWLIEVDLCRIIRMLLGSFMRSNPLQRLCAMRQFSWLALAGFLVVLGCGSDAAIKPTPNYAADWVGEYEGSGSFALSNGTSGDDRPITMTIAMVNPKQITVAAELVYGTGRNDFTRETAILTPDDPDQFSAEFRFLNGKTVYSFNKDGDTITGSIVTSTVRPGGTWTQDKSMVGIEVIRQ